jgi:hypothetical protein
MRISRTVVLQISEWNESSGSTVQLFWRREFHGGRPGELAMMGKVIVEF